MGDYGDAMMRNQNAAVQARTKVQNRANVLQLKMIGQGHPTGLTANLLKLFEARPPLDYKPPLEKRKCLPYTGMAQFVSNFASPGDPEYALPMQEGETPAQRRSRIHQLRLEEGAKKAAEELEKYDPNNDPNISGDPYKTLFVARLNYETTESKIKREFEAYGPIKRVRLITDKDTNKPRGYAFIEFVHTRDMKAAYKQADGKKIDNRRVLVDVERGRTVPNWRPRRLGGGLGTTRIGGEEVSNRTVGREQVQSGGISRSEEPRVRDERDREKSRDRGKDREREREISRERSHDRTKDRERSHDRTRVRERSHDRTRDRERSHDRSKDREHREDRHRRDHDRTRDKKDRGMDRERERDRDRTRDRDRVRDRGYDRHHEKDKDRGRDLDVDEANRGRSRDKKRKYDDAENNDGRPDQTDHGNRETEYDYYEHQGRGKYDDPDGGLGHHDNDQYDQMAEGAYAYNQATSQPQDMDYRRSERSVSHEYEY